MIYSHNKIYTAIQLNLNSSYTDVSFTITNSNLFLCPYEILPIAQEKQILREIVLFFHQLYV